MIACRETKSNLLQGGQKAPALLFHGARLTCAVPTISIDASPVVYGGHGAREAVICVEGRAQRLCPPYMSEPHCCDSQRRKRTSTGVRLRR